MNWLESPPALPPGWVDVWAALRPGQPGLTYDAAANAMLTHRFKGNRLDRWGLVFAMVLHSSSTAVLGEP